MALVAGVAAFGFADRDFGFASDGDAAYGRRPLRASVGARFGFTLVAGVATFGLANRDFILVSATAY